MYSASRRINQPAEPVRTPNSPRMATSDLYTSNTYQSGFTPRPMDYSAARPGGTQDNVAATSLRGKSTAGGGPEAPPAAHSPDFQGKNLRRHSPPPPGSPSSVSHGGDPTGGKPIRAESLWSRVLDVLFCCFAFFVVFSTGLILLGSRHLSSLSLFEGFDFLLETIPDCTA
jgi:hypothetical protein